MVFIRFSRGILLENLTHRVKCISPMGEVHFTLWVESCNQSTGISQESGFLLLGNRNPSLGFLWPPNQALEAVWAWWMGCWGASPSLRGQRRSPPA